MNSYASSNYNKISSFLRLVDTMKRAKENQRSFTLFIGAGCSLSSSLISISTESLVLHCLQDHFDKNYKKPDTWEQLYRDFINHIWANIGEEDRREILAAYFKGLKPGSGYQNLRLLVENGYINQIITTNFDVLINEAFQGLSYKLKVGDTPIRAILGGSKVCVFKVHGDIENGELRFAPDELSHLSEDISSIINSLTECSCLFCGYRGQDIGIMNSISNNVDHSVFWAVPTKPIEDDCFENRKIYRLLENRRSQNNFIYGKELGDFDKLMAQLVKSLLNEEPLQTLPVAWNKSIFERLLSVNPKVLHIFKNLLSKSEELKETYSIKIKAPFFSTKYQTVLEAFLFYFSIERNLPIVLQIPDNEVEALLVGLAIEILSRTASCDVTPVKYAFELRKLYERTLPAYQPDDTFWSALYIVLESCQSQLNLVENISQIRLIMNQNGRFTFNVKEPKLEKISNVLSILSVCGLFLPTCDGDTPYDIRYKSKKLLESRGHQEKIDDQHIIFKIDAISKNDFINIYHSFFEERNAELDKTGKIILNSVIIEANLKDITYQNATINNLTEYIDDVTKKTTDEFCALRSAFELEQGIYVTTPLEQELLDFASSKQSGMFIVGSSGSGKTKALQHFIEIASDKYIIAATAPKCGRMDNHQGFDIFFNDAKYLNNSKKETFVESIDILLKNQNKILVLIIDGINEITGGFQNCILHYKNIIQDLKNFLEWKISNIKFIVTCRDFAFLDYCKYTDLYPSAENCYYQTSGNSIKPYYQILPLTLDLQLKFCEAYITNNESRELFIQDLKNNKYFQQTFTSPYLIAIVGNHYKQNIQERINLRIHDIFSEFTKQMIKRLNQYKDESIAYQIINNYFELILTEKHHSKRLTPFLLLERISDSNRSLYVLNQLRDLNLFIGIENSEYIRFSHDKIEEYFLTEFLFNNDSNSDVMRCILSHSSHDPIYWFGLQNYIKCCMEKGYYEQIICNLNLWYYEDSELLPLLFMSGLNVLQKDESVKFMYVAKNHMQSMEILLSLIRIGLKKSLNNSNIDFPIDFVDMTEQFSVIFPEFKRHKAYIYYIASQYYYLIKNNQDKSLLYCKKALKNNDNDEILKNLIELQNTIIEKRNGNPKDIFDKFSILYDYFSSHDEWEYATECVLEWGSALRQKTHFEDALAVYNKINLNNIKKHHELVAKLHRKKGTIYKNMLQSILRKDQIDRNKIQNYYDKAMTEYSNAMSALKCVNDVSEMISIYAEQAEATLKVALSIPELRSLADIYINEQAKLLSYLPIPDRMVVYLRELAMMAEQDGIYDVAFEKLLSAKQYATKHSLSFRIFEVNYQLGRLTDRVWDYLTDQQKVIGISALDEAIQYPLENDNQYHNICIQTKERISKRLS